jgi:DNA-binding CsgD family transcriptional regulator
MVGHAAAAYAWLGLVEFLRGDWDAAVAHMKEGTRQEPPTLHALNGLEWGPFFQTLAYRGERTEALAVLDRKRAELPRAGQPNGYGSWHLLLWVTEGLYVLGERGRAAALYRLVSELAATGVVLQLFQGRLVERVAGIAAAAGERWEVAEAHFLTALRQAEELPHRLEQAETRRFYAHMLLERGAPGDGELAGRLLADAIEEYRRIGMPRHEELARALAQVRPGHPAVQTTPACEGPRYPDSLTAREAEILELLAAGLTSGELAAKLFLSVATVQRHIANIYGKIGARNRAEATAYALRCLADPGDT